MHYSCIFVFIQNGLDTHLLKIKLTFPFQWSHWAEVGLYHQVESISQGLNKKGKPLYVFQIEKT